MLAPSSAKSCELARSATMAGEPQRRHYANFPHDTGKKFFNVAHDLFVRVDHINVGLVRGDVLLTPLDNDRSISCRTALNCLLLSVLHRSSVLARSNNQHLKPLWLSRLQPSNRPPNTKVSPARANFKGVGRFCGLRLFACWTAGRPQMRGAIC